MNKNEFDKFIEKLLKKCILVNFTGIVFIVVPNFISKLLCVII